jgi:hypothetical protein
VTATVVTFPVTRVAQRATSSLGMARRPLRPQVMWSLARASRCGRAICSHETCGVWRRQTQLPCAECHQPIQPGERFHVRAVAGGEATEQVHANCPERTP